MNANGPAVLYYRKLCYFLCTPFNYKGKAKNSSREVNMVIATLLMLIGCLEASSAVSSNRSGEAAHSHSHSVNTVKEKRGPGSNTGQPALFKYQCSASTRPPKKYEQGHVIG